MAARVPSAGQDARNLQAIMLQAMRRARAELLDPPGGTEKARRFAEARAAARLRDLQADLRRMNAAAQQVVDRQTRAQFDRGVARADRLARDAGLVRDDAPVIGGLTGVETARAAVISRTYRADVDKAFASIKDVAGRSIREARALGWDNAKVKRILAGGAIDGVPAAALQRIRKIAETVKIDGYVEIPNANGGVTRIKPTVYADLVYQTAMAEAANVATVERLVARQSYYVKIIGSDSTNFCTAYKGKVYYIGPGTDPLGRFPNLSVLPRGGAPFHPRCTKRYAPFNPAAASVAELDAATPGPDANATNGKTSADAQQAFEQREAERKSASATQPPRGSPERSGTATGMKTPQQTAPAPSSPSAPVGDAALAALGPPTDSDVARAIATVERRIVRPEIRGVIDAGLEAAARRRFPLPALVRQVRVSGLGATTEVGRFDLRRPTEITFNTRWPHWGGADARAADRHRRGLWSTPAGTHVVFQEVGHLAHFNAVGPARFAELAAMPIGRLLSLNDVMRLEAAVSAYAAVSPLELVAEVAAMRLAGLDVPAWVLELYDQLGGP